MKRNAFTLMELMIVIVIIGILATVGMVMFGGQTEKAKIAATKANHKQVVKYVAVELMRCELGTDKVMDNNLTCSGRTDKKVVEAAVKALSDIKNPFDNSVNAVREGLRFNERDSGGYVNIYADNSVLYSISIVIKTCFLQPLCSDNSMSDVLNFD